MNTLNDILRRSAVGIVGLGGLTVGVVVALVSSAVLGPIDVAWSGLRFAFDPAGLPFLSLVGWVGLGAAVFVLGAALVALSLRRAKKTAGATTGAAVDQVSVSMHNLESLVQMAGERLAGVGTLSPHLVLKKDEWIAECDVYLLPGIERDMRDSIRENLQSTIERLTGRPVSRLELRFAEAAPTPPSVAPTPVSV